MLDSEQIPLGFTKLREDQVEIEEGLGEKSVLNLASAKQRLENLQNQRSSFASQQSWKKQIDVTERAIAILEGADGDKERKGRSTIANFFNKVIELFKGK